MISFHAAGGSEVKKYLSYKDALLESRASFSFSESQNQAAGLPDFSYTATSYNLFAKLTMDYIIVDAYNKMEL